MKNPNTKILGGTIIALVLIGSYHNSSQIHELKPAVLNDHDLSSPSRRFKSRINNTNGGLSQQQTSLPSCLKARTDTVPPSMFGKLPRPFVNLGFPKMGEPSNFVFFCITCFSFILTVENLNLSDRNLVASFLFRMW